MRSYMSQFCLDSNEKMEPIDSFSSDEFVDEIWEPPEAENWEDDEENSMAALDDDDDDDDDDGDGIEWAKPSSQTYCLREEKQNAMEEVMNGRFKALVSELLKKLGVDNCEKLDESWVNIVMPLAWQAASFLRPDMTGHKSVDPSGYVKIKCVASGSRNESQLIKGMVFKKHVAHKHMPTKYKNPRLLLIQGMLGQSSGSSVLSSFGSMTQDVDSIIELTKNLKTSQANVIFVEKSASRDVLEDVLKLRATMVLDMKLHRLERIARCTGSPILSSDISFSQRLKHCDSLYFEKFVEEHAIVGEGGKKPCKTLMFLDGCPTRLGCTILLKGSRSDELKKIKCVVQCAVVKAYHFILETSFLVDQKAMFSSKAFGQASDQGDTKPKECSEEDVTFQNHSQPLSTFATALEDDRRVSDDGEECSRPKDEISSVFDSESILVLMSSRNSTRGTMCEQSHFSHMKFYGNFDVPLGSFLQDNLFNQNLLCTACNGLPEAHIYSYAHHNKQLTVRVKRLGDKNHLPGEFEGKLWMWSRCGKCEPDHGNATKRVLISNAARGLSFGKFLELSFSSHSSFNSLSSCGHSFQKDFFYFFGLGSMVAMFWFSPFATYTVSVPAEKLEFNCFFNKDWLQQETESVSTKGLLLFTEVANHLKKIESRFGGSNLVLNGSSKAFSDILDMLKLERSEFEENIKNTGIKNESSHDSAHELLSLNRLRWEIMLEARIWDQRLQSLLSSSLASSTATDSAVPRQMDSKNSCAGGETEGLQTAAGSGVLDEGTVSEADEREKGQTKMKDHSVGQPERVQNAADIGHYDALVEGKEVCESCTDVEIQAEIATGTDKPSAEELPSGEMLQGDREQDVKNKKLPVTEQKVEELTSGDPFPCVSLFQESGSTSLLSDSDSHHTDLSNLGDSRGWIWSPFRKIREECLKDLRECLLPKFGHLPQFEQLHSPDFLPAVSQDIIEERSRLHIPISNSDYIVSDFDGEISSYIACALAMMNDLMLPGDGDSATLKHASSEPSSFDGAVLLDSLYSSEQLHPEVNLDTEKGPVKDKCSVVIVYASEFCHLRNHCCPSELDYIASLSRCTIWDAKGGKRKPLFSTTLDGRLIIKEIKQRELESFMKFAPAYFHHMKESLAFGTQICLAKILGIYKVTITHPQSGKDTKHNLMVQENLFYGRNITRQYDLKGTLHDRFNANADDTGDVLLDQNFINDMNSSPLCIGEKSKRLLQRAVWNDTSFLDSINVTGYSLLVGVDRQQHVLVCGMIDYLNQYTWDKQLETWVKSSLVVTKNVLPTIISPKEYKKRFRKFIDTHFITVPDHWCSQRSSNRCKLCGIKGDDSSLLKSEKREEELSGISSP